MSDVFAGYVKLTFQQIINLIMSRMTYVSVKIAGLILNISNL
jgi:hypothetical protein